jgi:hypothetical protein
VAGMEEIEASIGEADAQSRAAPFVQALVEEPSEFSSSSLRPMEAITSRVLGALQALPQSWRRSTLSSEVNSLSR